MVEFFTKLSGIVWGPYLIVLMLGVGIMFTIRLRFIQFRRFSLSFKTMLGNVTGKSKSEDDDGEISPFQALSTALASTVGVGNIAGVATAIAIGGPGAVFWMWFSAIFGMATKFSEIVIAMKYRQKDDNGTWRGGTMYVYKNGLGKPWLGALFAFMIAIVALVGCNMVQTNTAAASLTDSFNIPGWVTGLILTSLVAIVIVGGVKRLGKITSVLVPFMALFYIIGCLIILIVNIDNVIPGILLIVSTAFGGQEAVGGFTGATVAAAIQFGIARGIFSNEAGVGSSPIAHAAAKSKHPVEQGLMGIMEVFIDTIVVCTLTALAIVTTDVWKTGETGAVLTLNAFSSVFGSYGQVFMTIGVVIFAFSTVIGWSWYGESAISYLFGKKGVPSYRVIWLLAAFSGTISNLTVLWLFADVVNGIAVLVNLIAILFMSKEIVKIVRDYFDEFDRPNSRFANKIG